MRKVCHYCMSEYDGPNKVYCSQACNRAAYDLRTSDPRRWKLHQQQVAEWEIDLADAARERALREGAARLAKQLEPLIQAALNASPSHIAETPGGIRVTMLPDEGFHVFQYQGEGDCLDKRFQTVADVALWAASDANFREPDPVVWTPVS